MKKGQILVLVGSLMMMGGTVGCVAGAIETGGASFLLGLAVFVAGRLLQE